MRTLMSILFFTCASLLSLSALAGGFKVDSQHSFETFFGIMGPDPGTQWIASRSVNKHLDLHIQFDPSIGTLTAARAVAAAYLDGSTAFTNGGEGWIQDASGVGVEYGWTGPIDLSRSSGIAPPPQPDPAEWGFGDQLQVARDIPVSQALAGFDTSFVLNCGASFTDAAGS